MGWFVEILSNLVARGNWTFIAIIFGFCLIFAFIFVAFNPSDDTSAIRSVIGAFALIIGLVMWVSWMHSWQIERAHHAQEFVGHTYALNSIAISGSATEQGIWEYEMTKVRAEKIHREPVFGGWTSEDDTRPREAWGLVNLNYCGMKFSGRTRVLVVDCARVSSPVPLVKVKVLDNAHANQLFWLPASSITGRDCTQIK